MKHVGVAILGLGVVGSGTYEILTQNREKYQKAHNVDIEVVKVLEIKKDLCYNLGITDDRIAGSIDEICSDPNISIVVEVMGGITFARDFVLKALKSGKSVVTSNKELYCKYSYELEAVAKESGAGIYYEATCGGGIPVIRALTDNLQGNNVVKLMGIINGTTNYILTKMSESNVTYQSVLAEAQKLGYAEANPSSDVEGYDTTYKLSILSSLAFKTKVPYTKIYREGITEIEAVDIQYGKQLGYTLKLLAVGKNDSRGIEVRVHPTFIKNSHPLASVSDSYNAVFITGDAVEDVMLYGRGAGKLPTGSAIVGDVIYAAVHDTRTYSPFENTEDASPDTNFITNYESKYYIRMSVLDVPGALSKITAILSENNISVARAIQNGNTDDETLPFVVVTHMTHEEDVMKAVRHINEESKCALVNAIIRVN